MTVRKRNGDIKKKNRQKHARSEGGKCERKMGNKQEWNSKGIKTRTNDKAKKKVKI